MLYCPQNCQNTCMIRHFYRIYDLGFIADICDLIKCVTHSVLLAPLGALSRRIDRDNRPSHPSIHPSHPIPLIALTVLNHSIVI